MKPAAHATATMVLIQPFSITSPSQRFQTNDAAAASIQAQGVQRRTIPVNVTCDPAVAAPGRPKIWGAIHLPEGVVVPAIGGTRQSEHARSAMPLSSKMLA